MKKKSKPRPVPNCFHTHVEYWGRLVWTDKIIHVKCLGCGQILLMETEEYERKKSEAI